MLLRVLPLCAVIVGTALAQQGDKPGEPQPPPPASLKIPPAPPLSPRDALATFQLPPGFRIELAASEPLVQAPVAMTFDAQGRIWALEMRGFMRNVEGIGENQPVGRVVVLEDTDNDGVMNTSRVFLDGLVMPRALALARDGLLVAEPPNLWFCQDADGDGRADSKVQIASDYGSQANPEHTANGLLWAMDNWIYSANFTNRYRALPNAWQTSPTISRGQWGITQDNYGRLFYNSNSDQFRGDLVPSHYLNRNPNHSGAFGANVQIAPDQTVWPSRVNPGINRGYQTAMLRDGKLSRFTAACGPVIYRGHQFPEEFQGNAFVCEPSANFVRRNILVENNGLLTAANAYPQGEFLTSTDERFRPVNLYNGPDGALYVVDMYRGILQHRIYMTTFLRNQVLDRALDRPNDLGRIYRIVRDEAPHRPPSPLTSPNPPLPELVNTLNHPNGWWRDRAQQSLVERADPAAIPLLRKLLEKPATTPDTAALGRLHALWSLEGLAGLTSQIIQSALTDPHPKVRAAALRLAEPFLAQGTDPTLAQLVLDRSADDNVGVLWQLALTLGEIPGPKAEGAMASLLANHARLPHLRDAILSGLRDRELAFLERLLADARWTTAFPGAPETLKALSRCVFKEANPEKIPQLFRLASQQTDQASWRQLALLDGILATAPAPRPGSPPPVVRPINLPNEPDAWKQLLTTPNPETQQRLALIAPLINWPGNTAIIPAAPVEPLTPGEQALFEAGKTLYLVVCGACHQPHGQGQDGLAPPLVDSEWVLGSEARLIRITLQGMRGPVTVKGKKYELEMPSLGVLEDDQVAALLTYVRREWGHAAKPVRPEKVAQVRDLTSKREEAWTEAELLNIP